MPNEPLKTNPTQTSQGEEPFNWDKAKADRRNEEIQAATVVAGKENVDRVLTSGVPEVESFFLSMLRKSTELGKTPDEMVDIIMLFANALYDSPTAVNLDPTKCIPTMNTVIALLSPEPSIHPGVMDDAQTMAHKLVG